MAWKRPCGNDFRVLFGNYFISDIGLGNNISRRAEKWVFPARGNDGSEWKCTEQALKDDFKEKFTKVYPLNPHEQKQLDEFIEENLATEESDLQSHLWHHLFSSSKRKTVPFD